MKVILSAKNTVANLLITVLILLELFSCKSETKNNAYSLTIDKLYWIVGNWKCRGEEGIIFEKWTRSSDKLLKGMVYSLSGSDTLVLKRMSIKEIDSHVYYIVRFEHNDSELSLKLVGNSSKGLLFENSEQDFPNKIIYANTDGNMLLARFEGIREGKPDTVRFYMNRDLNYTWQ